MLVITGSAGFIGSCLAHFYHSRGREILLVDDFSRPNKWNNLEGLDACARADRMDYLRNPAAYGIPEMVLHIGARTDTSEFNTEIFDQLNLNYSRKIWEFCTEFGVPLIYASSAATYGDGSAGFSDRHDLVPFLKPLNPYGQSKQDMDVWALQQSSCPPFWAGLKFFNVYGPNEYHKGRMASVVFHTWQQIRQNGKMRLFRSHRSDYKDGMQRRDFIYIKDLIALIDALMIKQPESGIYNAGTGVARSFLDLAGAVFDALGKEKNIEFIDIPEDIRANYQYFTEADMQKWVSQGILPEMGSLENQINDYITHYLNGMKYYSSHEI